MVKVDTSFKKVLPLGPRTRLDFLAVATVTDATTEERGEESLGIPWGSLTLIASAFKPSSYFLFLFLSLTLYPPFIFSF